MNDEMKQAGKVPRKWLRMLFFSCACLATLIALFYVEEDLRGKYDWESCQHQAEAKGQKFDLSDFLPPPVPDDQNFAMSPVWIACIKYFWQKEPTNAEAWYGDRVNDADVAKFFDLMPVAPDALVGTRWANSLPPTPQFQVRWTSGQTFDLKPWQSYYRNVEETNSTAQISITPQPQSPAADVLLALSKYDPVVEQLRQDSQRPFSRFPVQYDIDNPAEILLPHLAAVKQTAQVLELRSIAELQNGQTDQAFDDVKLILRLNDAIQTEPFIISHLVRMAVMQMAIQCIYEGLADHQWSNAQLAEFDKQLAKLDYLADYQNSIRAEYAAHNKVMEWIAQKRSRSQILLDLLRGNNYATHDLGMTVHFAVAEFYLAPKGWFYQADIVMANDSCCWVSAVDDGQQIVSPAKISQVSKTVEDMLNHRSPFNFLERFLAPELTQYAKRTAFAQESVGLTRTAIALERFYLKQGAYPDSLDALAPAFIPQVPTDIINGQPLHYRLTSDGQFILYSDGWNETDDGGIAHRGGSMGVGIDIDRGDWVWRYPKSDFISR